MNLKSKYEDFDNLLEKFIEGETSSEEEEYLFNLIDNNDCLRERAYIIYLLSSSKRVEEERMDKVIIENLRALDDKEIKELFPNVEKNIQEKGRGRKGSSSILAILLAALLSLIPLVGKLSKKAPKLLKVTHTGYYTGALVRRSAASLGVLALGYGKGIAAENDSNSWSNLARSWPSSEESITPTDLILKKPHEYPDNLCSLFDNIYRIGQSNIKPLGATKGKIINDITSLEGIEKESGFSKNPYRKDIIKYLILGYSILDDYNEAFLILTQYSNELGLPNADCIGTRLYKLSLSKGNVIAPNFEVPPSSLKQ